MATDKKNIKVEVVYATPTHQRTLNIEISEGSTIEQAIIASGILTRFPDIDLSKQQVGIFSQKKSLNDLVNHGDRIEIYRELVIDPREARKKRAEK